MEVIYGNKKNNQEVKLPLNIKKYGKTDGRCKVYIEDYVMTYIKEFCSEKGIYFNNDAIRQTVENMVKKMNDEEKDKVA